LLQSKLGSFLHLVTGELVHDPWAAHFTGQHHLLQLGSSLGRHTVAPSSWAGRDPGNQDKLMESLASESFTTLLVDLGWSMVPQLRLS